MNFGERVKYYRERAGLTQQELADAVGLAQKASISKIELSQAQANQTMIVKIAAALGVLPTVFFSDTELKEAIYDPVDEYVPGLRRILSNPEESWKVNTIRGLLGLPQFDQEEKKETGANAG